MPLLHRRLSSVSAPHSHLTCWRVGAQVSQEVVIVVDKLNKLLSSWAFCGAGAFSKAISSRCRRLRPASSTAISWNISRCPLLTQVDRSNSYYPDRETIIWISPTLTWSYERRWSTPTEAVSILTMRWAR